MTCWIALPARPSSASRSVLMDEKASDNERTLAAQMCYWLWDDREVQDSIKSIVQRTGNTKFMLRYEFESALVAYAHGVPVGSEVKSLLWPDTPAQKYLPDYFDGGQVIHGLFSMIRSGKYPSATWHILISDAFSELSGTFSSVDPAQPYIRSVLADRGESDATRVEAAYALGFLSGAYNAYKVLQDALVNAAHGDPSAEVRAEAVRSLGAGNFDFIPDAKERMSEAQGTILHALQHDPSAKVRAASLSSLQCLVSNEIFIAANPDARRRFASTAKTVLRRKGESGAVKAAAKELLAELRKKK